MKHLLQKFFILLLCLPVCQLQAKDIFGFMTGNGNPEQIPIGMYQFDSETLERESLAGLMVGFWGGAFAEDTYYFIHSSDYQGYIYNGLSTFDLTAHTVGSVDPSQFYQCSDLTYDVTTRTMYGLQIKSAGENIPHTLIAINLQNGMSTPIAQVSTPIAAIACNNWGELYAMGYDANLYRMDKQSGELTLIGSTGITTDQVQAQSMEFDRETGLLYWTCLNTAQDALLVKLDIYSSTPVIDQKVMTDNTLIVGLHIPVTPIAPQAPEAPSQLSVKSNGSKAMLSWTNPAQTYTGQPLGQLTRIEILRNNEIIHTIDNPQPGAEMTWEDTPGENLGNLIRYSIYARNEAGRSKGISQRLLIGEDIPSAVTDLKISTENGKARLSWTAPTVGQNGGELTPSQLRYTLTRMPDKKVFEGLQGTSFVDETIETSAYYHYNLVCYNKAGKSKPAASETLILGQPIEAPYSTDFSTELLAGQWKIINANKDKTTWEWKDGKFIYAFCFGSAGDDHLVSVPFRLEKGVNYAVKYTIEAPSMFSNPEHFALKIGNRVIEDLDQFNNEGPEERTVPFTVTEDGLYEFTLSALSPSDNWQIVISSFAVEKMVTRDLAISGLTVPTEELQEGIPATLSATIINKGIEAVSAYQVIWTDQEQHIIATQDFQEQLGPNASQSISLEWQPDKSVREITATVRLEGDRVASNNTAHKKVYVLGQDETYLERGEKTSQPDWFPFAFFGQKYSYAQAIYFKEELNMPATAINGICYDYNNYGAELAGKHVRVYLANTEENSLQQAGWFDESNMVQVFDGIVDFERGKHSLRLVFDQPFTYEGQNLAVYTQKLDDDSFGDIYFYAKNYEGSIPRTAIYMNNQPQVSMNLVKGSTMLNHITFRVPVTATSIENVVSGHTDFDWQIEGRRLMLSQEAESATVYDMNGRLIQKLQHTQTIDLTDSAPGVYLISLMCKGQQTVRKAILK